MPQLTLNVIIYIVIGLVVALGLIALFWGTISQFLPWVKGAVLKPGVDSAVRAQCVLQCTQAGGKIDDANWVVSYDLDGNGFNELVKCTDGGITWTNPPQGVTPPTYIAQKADGTSRWDYHCGAEGGEAGRGAGRYKATCPDVAKAVLDSLGGCTAADCTNPNTQYKNVCDQCC